MPPLDPSIPLRVKPFEGISPQGVLSLHNLSQQMRMQDEQMGEIRRKRDVENQLRSLYARPDALDPKTGMPTETTLAQVAQVSPEAYVATRGKIVDAEAKRAEAEKDLAQARDALGKVNERDRKIMGRIQVGAHQAYEKAKAETNDENLAIQAAQEYFTGELSNEDKLGVLSKQFVTNSRPFDPKRSAITIEALRSIDSAPRKRERFDGSTVIQEEFDPVTKTWKEYGRGDRFAKTVAPTAPANDPLVPVKGDDGKVIYLPRSQAAGREVGSRTTDQNLPKQVQQLGRDFEKAGLPTSIAVMDEALKITPEQAKWMTGPKGEWVPDNALKAAGAPEGTITARQDLARLFNITLKNRSGAAVTIPELERLKEEFGKGLFRTPEALIGAINKARGIIDRHYQSVAATHGKAALDAYNENLEAIGRSSIKWSDSPQRRASDGQTVIRFDKDGNEIKE